MMKEQKQQHSRPVPATVQAHHLADGETANAASLLNAGDRRLKRSNIFLWKPSNHAGRFHGFQGATRVANEERFETKLK